jgi:hypothetical protein
VSAEPADEYLLLDCELRALAEGSDGLFYPRSCFEFRRDYIETYGCSPRETLEILGVQPSQVEALSYDAVVATIRRALDRYPGSELCDDDEDPDEGYLVRHDVPPRIRRAFRICSLPARASSHGPRLRLLVDSATGVTFARLSASHQLSRPALIAFLEKAVGAPPHQGLGRLPKRLKVPRTLLKAVPHISSWCDQHRVTLVRPSSGGEAGAHHVRAWGQALASVIDHRRGWWHPATGVTAEYLERMCSARASEGMGLTRLADTLRLLGWTERDVSFDWMSACDTDRWLAALGAPHRPT